MSADEEAESDGDMDRHVSSGSIALTTTTTATATATATTIKSPESTSSLMGRAMPVVAELWLGRNVGICLKLCVLYSSNPLPPTVID